VTYDHRRYAVQYPVYVRGIQFAEEPQCDVVVRSVDPSVCVATIELPEPLQRRMQLPGSRGLDTTGEERAHGRCIQKGITCFEYATAKM